MCWLPPHGLHLTLDGRGQVQRQPCGLLLPRLRAHLNAPGAGGLVLLGAFGSGKTTLSQGLAAPDVVVVPLRMLMRGGSLASRWEALAQDPDAVASGHLRVVLDGLDEVARPGDGDYARIFEAVARLAGPRWILTSRTGYFRTDDREPVPGQVDSLRRPGVETYEIAPLQPDPVARMLGAPPLPEICSSPILLRLCLEAQAQDARTPAEVVDRWLAHVGARLDDLEALAWSAFLDPHLSRESASFPDLRDPRWQHQPLGRLVVQDADGHWRFGHRSLYDCLVARVLAPRLLANQGQGPDDLTGLGLSEAMRVFCAGLVHRATGSCVTGTTAPPASARKTAPATTCAPTTATPLPRGQGRVSRLRMSGRRPCGESAGPATPGGTISCPVGPTRTSMAPHTPCQSTPCRPRGTARSAAPSETSSSAPPPPGGVVSIAAGWSWARAFLTPSSSAVQACVLAIP